MTKEQLWKTFTDKNPHFLTGGANLTADGLQKFFAQVWKHAQTEGERIGELAGERKMRALMDMMDNGKSKDGNFMDMFKDVLGKGKGPF